jgi:hypothetical protein
MILRSCSHSKLYTIRRNALKHLPPGLPVSILLKVEGQWVKLVCQDN